MGVWEFITTIQLLDKLMQKLYIFYQMLHKSMNLLIYEYICGYWVVYLYSKQS